MNRLLLTLCLVIAGAYSALAADPYVTSIGPATGQVAYLGEIPNRYSGSPVGLIITFSEAVNIADISKLSFTNTDTASATLSVVGGSGQTQYLYFVRPLTDGPGTLTLAQGFATRASNVTVLSEASNPYNVAFDTTPAVTMSAGSTSTTSATFTASIISGLASDETTASPWNTSNLSFTGCTLVSAIENPITLTSTAPIKPIATLTITVTPLGYGPISVTGAAGLAHDKYSNQSAAVTGTTTITSPSGSAPVVTEVTGLDQDNKVYRTGDSLDIAVDFTAAVTNVGAAPPTLQLNSTNGGTPAVATFTRFDNGGTRLVFTYLVLSGHRSIRLDTAGTNALVVASSSAITSAAIDPGLTLPFLANTTLPAPGSANSLAGNQLYSINVESSKPFPNEVPGVGEPGKCGAGGGIAALLGLSALLLGARWRWS